MTKRSNRKAGGFRVPHRTGLLVFQDKDYAGAKVRVDFSVPLGVNMKIADAREELAENPRFAYTHFVEHGLVEWNLEDDDGNPIPATVEGIETLPLDFVLLMVREWSARIGEVPDPLDGTSNDGVTSAAEPIKMVAS